jgi:integrase
VVRPNRSVRTFQTYEEKVRLYVVPEIGNLSLKSVTPQRLARLYAKKSETLAPATVQLIHGVIYGAMKQAKRWGLVGTNPAELVERPARPRLSGDERAMSIEQARALRTAMTGHKFETFWIVLLNTGLRFGEAAALRWEDVDLTREIVRVQRTVTRVPGREGAYRFTPPKTPSSRRVIPLNGPALTAIRTQRRVIDDMREGAPRWAEPDLIFANGVGRPLREDHVLAAFHRICENAGLPRKRLHDLRHSAATLAHANGADLHDLKNLLGHSRIDMTSHIYTGYSVERVRGAMVSVGDLLSEGDKRGDDGPLPPLLPPLGSVRS